MSLLLLLLLLLLLPPPPPPPLLLLLPPPPLLLLPLLLLPIWLWLWQIPTVPTSDGSTNGAAAGRRSSNAARDQEAMPYRARSVQSSPVPS